MSVTRTLAKFLVSHKGTAVPQAVRHEATRALLNWVGCAIKRSATMAPLSPASSKAVRRALRLDAKAISDAGAFSVVVEGVAEPLAARITQMIPIPTIGIGASPACDGQILVMEDMLGLNPNPPRFVREYAHLGPEIEAAVKAYAADVRTRRFPGQENVYAMKKGVKAV